MIVVITLGNWNRIDRMKKAKAVCFMLWTAAVAGLGTAAFYLKDYVPRPEIIFH